METYDAIISGYGPTGATLANLLGTLGMKIAIIDREKGIFDKPRAITADHEAMRIFQAVGLAEEIAKGTCPHPGTDFLGVEGEVIKRFYPMPPPGPLGWEPTFMFYQPTLEAILRDGVKRFAHASVFLEHTLVSHQQDADGVTVDLRASDGTTRVLRGKALLACDGARSVVRGQLGVPLHDLAFDEWWVVVDATLKANISLPERCVQYCRPSRPGTYIVGPDTLRRWEIKVMPGESPEAFNDPAHLDKVLSTFVDTSGLDVKRVAIYRFHAVVAEQWRDRRVFLLGDAAHQMPPFLGQGLGAGVRDAYNLAWKLHAVLSGRANDTLLDTYCAERRPHVQTVVEHAKSFGLIIGELDESAARERDKRMRAELLAGSVPTSRQAFIPSLSAGLITIGEDGPLNSAGQLFPQPWVSSKGGEEIRLDDLVRSDFYIVCADVVTSESARCSLAAHPNLAGVKVVCLDGQASQGILSVAESGALVREWLTKHNAVSAIVRPDGFAFGATSDGERLQHMIADLAERLDPASYEGREIQVQLAM
ncbi:bifunctional 3-(3-hydroxy-phenyl)propionate/3-hydroxycinnamic acid hydroxylase MhpA [Paraburkholderia tropica]|uniref:bifunctional 3-(3-hydroxy-phenyl)propionate/3-hydroxycinnamic acid hydroxylase MhpA n=1 Tax=Paraburkholderia tropica TaxID=92647 RepID=UPI002AB7B481|nr:bifunctional 3-(3-hydroxy-phenyl)propionate/3-hydroxycinnamic acid hydroxylase [Paraburkholderia tropica]